MVDDQRDHKGTILNSVWLKSQIDINSRQEILSNSNIMSTKDTSKVIDGQGHNFISK